MNKFLILAGSFRISEIFIAFIFSVIAQVFYQKINLISLAIRILVTSQTALSPQYQGSPFLL